MTHQFLESQATHLMWIDSDIGFNAMDIVSMLIADKDIVCGIYPKKEIDWARVAQAVKDGVPPEELSNHAGSFAVKRWMAPLTVPTPTLMDYLRLKPEVPDSCSSSAACSTLCPTTSPTMHQTRKSIKEFYATTIDPESGRLIAEDYHFCRLARSHGFKIYAAPWVRLGHAGTYVFDRRFDLNWLKLKRGSAIDLRG